MKQLTENEAVIVYESEIWKCWSDKEIVEFQLFQDRLAVPFGIFHQAVGNVLGRPVWTHEFADQKKLQKEYLRKR